MQRIKNISKLSFLLLMMVAGIVTFSSVAQASNFKPYEYTFESNDDNKFFNIKGVKDLQITFFDHSINPSATPGHIKNNIYVVQRAVNAEGNIDEAQALKIVERFPAPGAQTILTIHYNLE